jgi:hypothetical protein
MARIGLTLYLIIATLVGPWLCCCASVRWITTSLSTPATSDVAPRTCCGRANRDAESKPSKKPNREQKTPTPLAPCSCALGQSPILFADSDIVGVDLRAEQTDTTDWSRSLSTISTIIVGALNSFHRSAHFPNLTAQDILRALSVMRC